MDCYSLRHRIQEEERPTAKKAADTDWAAESPKGEAESPTAEEATIHHGYAKTRNHQAPACHPSHCPA